MSYEAVEVTVMNMTGKAVLCRLEEDEDKREVWVPMSVIFEDDLADLTIGLVAEINVAQWFYRKEIE